MTATAGTGDRRLPPGQRAAWREEASAPGSPGPSWPRAISRPDRASGGRPSPPGSPAIGTIAAGCCSPGGPSAPTRRNRLARRRRGGSDTSARRFRSRSAAPWPIAVRRGSPRRAPLAADHYDSERAEDAAGDQGPRPEAFPAWPSSRQSRDRRGQRRGARHERLHQEHHEGRNASGPISRHEDPGGVPVASSRPGNRPARPTRTRCSSISRSPRSPPRPRSSGRECRSPPAGRGRPASSGNRFSGVMRHGGVRIAVGWVAVGALGGEPRIYKNRDCRFGIGDWGSNG